MTMRYLVGVAAGVAVCVSAARAERDLSGLTILGPDYPGVFFFRGSEGGARRAAEYEAWEAEFSRLMGIMGKCLDEEIVGHMPKNHEYFNRFKARHADQTVLLHFNGNSRDPRFELDSFFPGHWVYRRAVRILEDVPAADGESVIRVDDVSDFKVNSGRYRTSNDDIALFGMTAGGTHDWSHFEHTQLISVDPKAGTIRVRRGQYGSTPRAFKAGASRAAAHAVEGPWGKNNHLMWYHNFTTHCPKDGEGKTCSDRLIDDLARWFGRGGVLEKFDGLEFDVLFNDTHGDTTGDGMEDDGVMDGVNRYGIGVVEFVRGLRARMGPQFIMQADGALGPGGVRSQRAFGLFNGIESEGWPNLKDWEFDDWSGGLNRHLFWQANAHAPAFSYINHKWNEGVPGQPGVTKNPDVPMSSHRLVFAAAQMIDAKLCYSFAPPRGSEKGLGVWDEFHAGEEGRLGWLGRPEGPPVLLASNRAKNLWEGIDWTARVKGDVKVRRQSSGGWIVEPATPGVDRIEFTIPDMPAMGSNLVVFASLSGAPGQGYPREMARFAELGVSGGEINLTDRPPDESGMRVRGGTDVPLDRDSGARLAFQSNYRVGADSLPAMVLHPPYQSARGMVYWIREVEVPPDSDLYFSLGMAELAPARSDGIWYSVLIAEVKNGAPGEWKRIFESSTKEHRWIPHSVSLREWGGRRVRLRFEADCGPKDNATTDQGAWGYVRIIEPSAGGVTKPERFMSWVNDRPFDASFYFRRVGSKTVDVTVSIEGGEPLILHSLSAHAHPDARARVFERGIVLANPSTTPFDVDLKSISPDRSYRRIQGSRQQDPKTNSGQPVRDRVRLGGLDGLFLMRAD